MSNPVSSTFLALISYISTVCFHPGVRGRLNARPRLSVHLTSWQLLPWSPFLVSCFPVPWTFLVLISCILLSGAPECSPPGFLLTPPAGSFSSNPVFSAFPYLLAIPHLRHSLPCFHPDNQGCPPCSPYAGSLLLAAKPPVSWFPADGDIPCLDPPR